MELICLGSKSIGSFFSFKQKKNKCIFGFSISASVQQPYCHPPLSGNSHSMSTLQCYRYSAVFYRYCYTTGSRVSSKSELSTEQRQMDGISSYTQDSWKSSQESSLEASFTPGTGNENCCKGFMKHKTKGPFRCVCGGINSSSEPPVFLFMSIFNIFDEFHNNWCLCSLGNNKTLEINVKFWFLGLSLLSLEIEIEIIFSKAYKVP